MKFLPRLAVVSLAGYLVGCGAGTKPVAVPQAAVTNSQFPAYLYTSVRLPPPPPDPVADFIASIEEAFAAGQQELNAGRLVAAREHFDAAVDRMLALPEGARRSPRIATEFERLLDRISALEVLMLRDGDGLNETKSEPAAIDELLSAAMFERPRPALTTEETVIADLARTPHDIDIPVNERVLSFIELFQGRLHELMEAGLQRSTRYVPMIQTVFREEGLPLDLAYVPLVESAFKPNALSRVSARGMWQFMLPTAQEFDLQSNWFIDERSDPEKATRAAAAYLKYLRDFFDGDWHLALASYNAGQGRIQRALQKSKREDFWEVTSTSRYLPRETRDYVPMILAAMIIAKNPGLYGFEVGAAAPLAYETVAVPNALDLKYIAEWAGVSVEAIQELNPELRRTTTPMTRHELRVPVGTAAPILAQLPGAESLYASFKFHTVRRGETLATIARKYKITQTDLRQANDMRTSRVRANQSLMIPQRPAAGLPSAPPSARGTSARTARPTAATTQTTYRVQRGDTLSSIARQFDMSIADLKKMNRLSTDKINIGDRLTVRR
ncbi:MAG TPA: LysM peptidoglycan-binding domain-containing protein [Vicinamibacterales bacterium]|nr:LysM peptidoglycan-binding domain-containing protein [Vicinamibacterales bacterium]